VWSPNFCLYEKLENMKKINDDRVELSDRLVTLEGKEHMLKKSIFFEIVFFFKT